MKRIILIISLLLIQTDLFSDDPKPAQILFPEGLYKYLPDSIAVKFDSIIQDAIDKKLPNEYLWSFLPDSITRMLPDSIHLFTPKIDPDAGKLPFTSEDLMSLRRISEIQVSPDGGWILYTLKTPFLEGNSSSTDIWAVKSDGSANLQITTHGSADYNPRWSPDGKQIAFLSTRTLDPQIFVMDFPKGEPKQITDVKGGVANISWSPDGKYFSFTSEVKLDKDLVDKYPKQFMAKMRIYDKLPVRHWDEWIDGSYSHLFVISSQGGEDKDLMKDEKYDTPLKPFGGAEDIAWSPDGKEIAYTCKKVKDFAKSTNSDIYIVNIETGATKNITEGMPGYDMAPLYSPDGKWIAFVSMERPGFESDKRRLMLYNRKNGKISELTSKYDGWVEEIVWHPDSKSLYFTSPDKGTVKIFRIAVESIKHSDKSLSEGDFVTVTDGWFDYDGISISKDGKTLVFGKESMLEPKDIYMMSSNGGEQKKLTHLYESFFLNILLPRVEEKWVTCTDGAQMHTWILYPPRFDSTKTYPMITFCQGGPQSMISQKFHYRWNYLLLASHGYVLVLPNRRGVPGFGQKWNDAISRDWGGKPMQDIMSATDIMLKKPFIDKKGSAAIGASAGGYAVFWLAGNHKGRYNAFLSHCGVFNLESMYGSTEELWFPDWEYGGPYWDEKNKEYYAKHSPHKYAQNWDTPIMISTGEKDYRVPFTQSLEAFTVAQSKGIDSKLVVFPNENHFILHPQEFIIWDSEVFEFLDKYCKRSH
jgi:dipeptidyl aminopeptidase/acylaminoacyl peptidase